MSKSKEGIIFRLVDRMNRSGDYSNPHEIRSNVRELLEDAASDFIDLLEIPSRGVDIGSGRGELSKILKPRVTSNLDIHFSADCPQPRIHASAEDLPFDSNSLDYALFFYVLHHIEDPRQAVSESVRVLKRGGILVTMLETLRFPGQSRLLGLNERSMEGILNRDDADYTGHEKYFTKREFEQLTRDMGLKLLSKRKIEPYKGLTRIIKPKKTLYVMEKR